MIDDDLQQHQISLRPGYGRGLETSKGCCGIPQVFLKPALPGRNQMWQDCASPELKFLHAEKHAFSIPPRTLPLCNACQTEPDMEGIECFYLY
jgi:hypothetical protein